MDELLQILAAEVCMLALCMHSLRHNTVPRVCCARTWNAAPSMSANAAIHTHAAVVLGCGRPLAAAQATSIAPAGKSRNAPISSGGTDAVVSRPFMTVIDVPCGKTLDGKSRLWVGRCMMGSNWYGNKQHGVRDMLAHSLKSMRSSAAYRMRHG